MNVIKKLIIALSAVALLLFASGCVSTDAEYEKRMQQNKEAQSKNTLEKQNLQKKLKLEEDPERLGYVTLLAGVGGEAFGYYPVKGKISSSGSQLDPEDLVNCGYNNPMDQPAQSYCEVVDGPQDDGTYGTGDPGYFFFTPDGTFVEFTGYYVYSSQPLPSALNIPKLG